MGCGFFDAFQNNYLPSQTICSFRKTGLQISNKRLLGKSGFIFLTQTNEKSWRKMYDVIFRHTPQQCCASKVIGALRWKTWKAGVLALLYVMFSCVLSLTWLYMYRLFSFFLTSKSKRLLKSHHGCSQDNVLRLTGISITGVTTYVIAWILHHWANETQTLYQDSKGNPKGNIERKQLQMVLVTRLRLAPCPYI